MFYDLLLFELISGDDVTEATASLQTFILYVVIINR